VYLMAVVMRLHLVASFFSFTSSSKTSGISLAYAVSNSRRLITWSARVVGASKPVCKQYSYHWDKFYLMLRCGVCSVKYFIFVLRLQGRPWFQKFNCSSYHLQGLPARILLLRWHNPSGRTMALVSTQPLTEMSKVKQSR
jgi:hypothetical protein